MQTDLKPVLIEAVEDFADHRALQCENYSVCFDQHHTMFTSKKGTLYVNPEGGSVILPEENEEELQRLLFRGEYFVSFYPNQQPLVKTNTGIFICSTEDLFKGFYSFGIEDNVPSANRGTVLKRDRDLYYLNTEGDVCHYDLQEIVEDLRFKQETWSYKNVQKPKSRIPAAAKEIADAYHDDFYTVTCTGNVVHYPSRKELKVSEKFEASRIYFTEICASPDFVCISGYMPHNSHNVVQLVRADLSKETDGPIMNPAESGHVHNGVGFKRKETNYFIFSCYYREFFMYGVRHEKLVEVLRTKIDSSGQDRTNHGLCFEFGDTDKFHALIAFGQGYIKRIKLKFQE